ncbi:MAG: HEPN domain-containing protein [Firmicutes bacterium]|nr:HEPN domain-containing protein [Bacillota bacterium]
MPDPRGETVVSLLRRAASELLAAQILAEEGEKMEASVVFHAQRAAENALAAFLATRGAPARVKNLPGLLQEVRAFLPAFAQVRLDALKTPATALAEARRILALVTDNLPSGMGKAVKG